MKRLTERRGPECSPYVLCEVCGKTAITECFGERDCIQTLADRLATIEDILGDEYSLDRLRELVEADKAGRCVVLPCKVGDTVYKLDASICKYRDQDECDEYCDGFQYRDCWEGEMTVCIGFFSFSDLPKIGKTVFRTREEAEAALGKMKEAAHG